jgi:hypothetical protein
MVGRTKSNARKKREFSSQAELVITRACRLYDESRSPSSTEAFGYRTATTKAQQFYYDELGHWISVQHTTVRNRHQGLHQPSDRAQFLGGNTNLSLEEESQLLDYLDEVSRRGFPLTHSRLAECANHVIRSRDPDFQGVGKNWSFRFLDRHFARLKTSWSKTLDNTRSAAVNPTAVKEFFDILDRLFREHGFVPECIHGADESGLTSGLAQKERVIGSRKYKIQYQVCLENRENTTIIVCICADGSVISPVLVMKGQGFGVRWAAQAKETNELNARYIISLSSDDVHC